MILTWINMGMNVKKRYYKSIKDYYRKKPTPLIISYTFNERIEKLKTLLNVCMESKIYFHQRKDIIRLLGAKAMLRMLYPATILYTPDKVIKKVDDIFSIS